MCVQKKEKRTVLLLRILMVIMYKIPRMQCVCPFPFPPVFHFINGQIPFEMLAVQISTLLLSLSYLFDPILISSHITFLYFLAFSLPKAKAFSHLPDLNHHFVAYQRPLLWPALAASTGLRDCEAGQS